MDYGIISCGVVGQMQNISVNGMVQAAAAISNGIGSLVRDGYRRFLVAVTGDATLLFAKAVLIAGEQNPEIALDILLPFNGWIDGQADSARYKQITIRAESVNYSCEEEFEDSVDICNTQLIGFGRCTIVIHGGEDEAMSELITEARDAEQEIHEILI